MPATTGRCLRAAQYVAATGATFAAASRKFKVAAAAIRATAKRHELARVTQLPRMDLAVALVEQGEATTRKAALVYGLAAADVLAAFSARYPSRARRWV